MNKTTTNLAFHFTGSTSLAALGLKIRQLDLSEPIRTLVSIPQKIVTDSPFGKLLLHTSPSIWPNVGQKNG